MWRHSAHPTTPRYSLQSPHSIQKDTQVRTIVASIHGCRGQQQCEISILAFRNSPTLLKEDQANEKLVCNRRNTSSNRVCWRCSLPLSGGARHTDDRGI